MRPFYRHTHIGYLLIAFLAAGVVGLSASHALARDPQVLSVAVAILGLCLLLFPTLTVVVEGHRVRCFFGLGLIRRRVPVSEILAVSTVRNPWTYGWGLRLIPGGWLWNVSGFDAVELRLQNGKVFRIGTDEPVALHAAIASAMRADREAVVADGRASSQLVRSSSPAR
jgi:hypothetical protein